MKKTLLFLLFSISNFSASAKIWGVKATLNGASVVPDYEGVGVQRITSAAKILAPAGAVNFNAPNSITLNPGFEARGVGKYFKAQIGANSVCSN